MLWLRRHFEYEQFGKLTDRETRLMKTGETTKVEVELDGIIII